MIINNKRTIFKVVLLSTIFMCVACTTNDFFNEYQSLPNGWKKNEKVVFDFESLDTITKRNMYLNIRTTNDYPYSNLFVIIKSESPEGDATVDTLQYQMANADGSMLGSGFTDIKEHRLIWRTKKQFKKQGVYKFEIAYAMRKLNQVNGDDVLTGITEVGLQVQ